MSVCAITSKPSLPYLLTPALVLGVWGARNAGCMMSLQVTGLNLNGDPAPLLAEASGERETDIARARCPPRSLSSSSPIALQAKTFSTGLWEPLPGRPNPATEEQRQEVM